LNSITSSNAYDYREWSIIVFYIYTVNLVKIYLSVPDVGLSGCLYYISRESQTTRNVL